MATGGRSTDEHLFRAQYLMLDVLVCFGSICSCLEMKVSESGDGLVMGLPNHYNNHGELREIAG